MNTKLLVVIVLYSLLSLSFSVHIDIDDTEAPYSAFLQAYPHVKLNDVLHISQEFTQEEAEEEPYVPPFSLDACPTIAPAPDTSDVNTLRPGNIKVVMAMGDSIAAGMSAKDTILIFLQEYRGLSFSIGGDNGIVTFPNILKPYTTSIYGASTGIGKRDINTNGLNAGVSGGVSNDMPGQAQWLVDKLKADPKVNLQLDWKVLTIWIASNNLCRVCQDDAANNGANYEAQLTRAFNILYDNVPRLYINLVAPLNVSTLAAINGGLCGTIHASVCPCVNNANNRAKVAQVTADMTARSYAMSKAYNARGRKDFAIVVQPFLEQNVITDRNLLSAADCFHPSAKGHVLGSVALWNNMLTPAASKKKTWNENDGPICPTAASVFYTN